MSQRELAFILILYITFHQRLQLSAAQKCKPLSGSNNFGIYRCQGVQTLSEIEEELVATWRGIVVSNRKEDYLDFTRKLVLECNPVNVDICMCVCVLTSEQELLYYQQHHRESIKCKQSGRRLLIWIYRRLVL